MTASLVPTISFSDTQAGAVRSVGVCFFADATLPYYQQLIADNVVVLGSCSPGAAQRGPLFAGLSSLDDVVLASDVDGDGAGDIVFETRGVERARIKSDGSGTGWAALNGGSLPAHEAGAGHDPNWGSVYRDVSYQRGIVILRFDDCAAEDATVVQPLLDAAYLPAGFAVIQGRLDTSLSGTLDLTTTQALALQQAGHEVMCHSRTHTDPTVQGSPASFFVDESETAANDLRSAGFNINAWVQPGTYTGAWSLDSVAKTQAFLLTDTIDELWRKNFASAEAYIDEGGGIQSTRALPFRWRYGYRPPVQITSTNGTGISSLATCEGFVDSVAQYGGSVALLFHSHFIGAAGEISLADFTALIAYIQARRDAGLIDVLTPTAARYAVQAPAKTNLLLDGGFELTVPGSFPAAATLSQSPAWFSPASAATAVNGQGRDSGVCAKVLQGFQVEQDILAHTTRSIRVDAWARNDASAGNITAELLVEGYQNAGVSAIVTKNTTLSVGQTYAQLRLLIGAHPNVDRWRITCTVSGAGTARFDDVSVVKT